MLVILVFAPVIIGAAAAAALLLGAATAGAWETIAERQDSRPAAEAPATPRVAAPSHPHARAA